MIVAAVSGWHQHHDAAVSELERRLAAGDEMVVAGHSVAEAYAVLTRLPSPYRLMGPDAARLILANFVDGASVISLDSRGYRLLLEVASQIGVSGGQTYDLLIAHTALQGNIQLLLTFNRRHFEHIHGIDIVTPRGTI